MSFALVLRKDERLPVVDVGRDVAQALERPLADVTRILRHSRGILDPGFTEGQAEVARRLLEARGIRCRVVPVEDLPVLPRPRLVRNADPAFAGLEIQAMEGSGPPILPWGRILIAAAGRVTITHTHAGAAGEPEPRDSRTPPGALMLAAFCGLPTAMMVGHLRPKVPKVRKRSREETVDVLDLVTIGAEDRYRIVAGRFVYDYLGDRISMVSSENFRSFLKDLARLAPKTLLTGSTLSFTGGLRGHQYRFRDPAEFDAYLRWAMAWPTVYADPA